MSSNIYIQRICQHCKTEFTARTTVTKYCGNACAKRAYKHRKREQVIELANKEFKAQKEEALTPIRQKEYLSIKEVEQLLGISRRTIYRMIDRKQIAPVKIMTRTIIPRWEIENLTRIL